MTKKNPVIVACQPRGTIDYVSQVHIQRIVRVFNDQHKNFAVSNVKKDGTTRKWQVSPKGGRAFIKGTGVPMRVLNMIKVFDISVAQGRDPATGRFRSVDQNGWRTLNLATVTEVRRGKTTFRAFA